MKTLIALCCAVLFWVPSTSSAQSLEVSPTILQFQKNQSHKSIRISNRGKDPVVVQARSFLWKQSGDEDSLIASSEVVVSPPIFTLQPGTTQTMRVMLRDSKPLPDARHFRLLIDDITPSPVGQVGSRLAIRLSLPMFAEADVPQPGHLRWTTDDKGNDDVVLQVVNDGRTYENIRMVELVDADGTVSAASPMASNTYILPGAARHWTVTKVNGMRRKPATLHVTTIAGVVSKVTLKD